MSQIKPKGTRDFLPEDTFKLGMLETLLKQTAETSCYREIRTPIFEHTDVFARSAGEGSDVVNKEMYTFLDRGNRSVSLRPEGTAGVIRSFVENKMYANADLPIRLYYMGPNFRYERPQAGRYRQFVQFGCENIGIKSPYIDAETILLAVDMLASVGITNIKLKINSIGDAISRKAYCEALRKHFEPYLPTLCEDCKVRFEKNPLRILDCKVDVDKECMKNYPVISDYLTDESKQYFAKVLELLRHFNIEYTVDEKLVRGLDYYNDTVFEIEAISPNGTDYGAILGGGRYDNLIKQFDGPELPSFGFGIGIDRLNELCKDYHIFDRYKDGITCYVMPIGEEGFDFAYYVTNYLRVNGVDAEMDYQLRGMKSQFKTVDRKNAQFSLIIGETEAYDQTISVRENISKEQRTVSLDELIPYLSQVIMNRQQEQHECGCGCGCEHDHHEHCDCGCEDDHCNCGCHDEGCHCHDDCCCDNDCDCGCHEGEECHCHDEHCECGCHDHKECGCAPNCHCEHCGECECDCKENGCRCKKEGHDCDGLGCDGKGCCMEKKEMEMCCHDGICEYRPVKEKKCGCAPNCHCKHCDECDCCCKENGCRCIKEGHDCDGKGCDGKGCCMERKDCCHCK